jgi:hypothetical protein
MSTEIIREIAANEEGYGRLIEYDAGFISKDLSLRVIKEGIDDSLDSSYYTSSMDLTKPIIFYATLQKYNVRNRNGRVYPENILNREVEKYKTFIKENSALGELDHPDSSIVSLKGGVPHRVLDLYWDGPALIGKLEILVSPGFRKYGTCTIDADIVANYLMYGIRLGISSRGVGSVKKVKGDNIVQDDFELICWDIVSTPSTPGSYIYKDIKDRYKFDEKLPESGSVEIAKQSSNNSNVSALQNFLKRMGK